MFYCNFCFTALVFDENKVKYRTKSSHRKDNVLLIFEIRVCRFLVNDMGGGGQEKKTKYDKGERVKNSDFRSDALFAWPLITLTKRKLNAHKTPTKRLINWMMIAKWTPKYRRFLSDWFSLLWMYLETWMFNFGLIFRISTHDFGIREPRLSVTWKNIFKAFLKDLSILWLRKCFI